MPDQPIPDEAALLQAIQDALCDGGEEQTSVHVTHPEVAARALDGLRRWLAGRAIINVPSRLGVVELPEPAEQTDMAACWTLPGWGELRATIDLSGRQIVQLLDLQGDDCVLPPDRFRAVFLAGLAACDFAERLPRDQPAGGTTGGGP
jgi:hypothetical protein